MAKREGISSQTMPLAPEQYLRLPFYPCPVTNNPPLTPRSLLNKFSKQGFKIRSLSQENNAENSADTFRRFADSTMLLCEKTNKSSKTIKYRHNNKEDKEARYWYLRHVMPCRPLKQPCARGTIISILRMSKRGLGEAQFV